MKLSLLNHLCLYRTNVIVAAPTTGTLLLISTVAALHGTNPTLRIRTCRGHYNVRIVLVRIRNKDWFPAGHGCGVPSLFFP